LHNAVFKVASQRAQELRKFQMTNDIIAIPPEQVPGRPFQKGRSGNPAGRRPGSRNKATLAAAKLLAGEADAQGRRGGVRWRPDGAAAVCRTPSAGLPRTTGQVQAAADREPGGYRRGDEGGHRGARRWRDHAGRGGQDRGNGRHFHPGDRHERFRPAPAGTRREVKAGRCRPNKERRRDLALQPIGEIPLLICCRLQVR